MISKKDFVQGIETEDLLGKHYKYRSLYSFLVDYKNYKRVSKIYKSAFLQDREEIEDILFIACETYDYYECPVTDKYYARICHMIEKHKKELMSIYSKSDIQIVRYSYVN